jgi:bifunctional non-homologous end joining protein LigD
LPAAPVPSYIDAVPASLNFIQPCSSVTAKSVPAGDDWLHEPKLAGYRLQVAKDGPTVRLHSRGGNDWTKRLAGLAEALAGIPCRSAVIDAELCLPGAGGAPNFAGLQLALMSRQHHKLTVYAFDLLHLDGQDLRPLPLTERRQRKVTCLHLVEAFEDDQALLEAAERHGLEGVVSKRRSSPYRSGECRARARELQPGP